MVNEEVTFAMGNLLLALSCIMLKIVKRTLKIFGVNAFCILIET